MLSATELGKKSTGLPAAPSKQKKLIIPFVLEGDDEGASENSGSDNSSGGGASDDHYENVNFPLTQSAPETTLLVQQAELSRRVFLLLIEKYNLAPSVILHALYFHSGNVADCEAYLADPKVALPWSIEEDHLILTDSDVSSIIEAKGLVALNERRSFLHQVCNEAISNFSEITSKLK